MPKSLKRYNGRSEMHFITFSSYKRRAFLRIKPSPSPSGRLVMHLGMWNTPAEFHAGTLSASRTQFRPDSLAR